MTIACPDCGRIQDVPNLPPGAIASCGSCQHDLERRPGRSVTAALACALATLVLLLPANLLPFMSISMAGIERDSRLASGVGVLWNQGRIVLALLIAAFVVGLPFVRFGLLTGTLGAVRWGYRPGWLGPAFRWATALDQWAMLDVFLVGCAIGYGRIVVYVPLKIGPGGWCFIAAAALSMICHASLDRRNVWRMIAPERAPPADAPALSCTSCDLVLPLEAEGGRCPRCRARLHSRKPDAMVRTIALVIAGVVLYGPANIYGMAYLDSFGASEKQTIFWGVKQLVEAQLWPLAAVIFTASIAIPLLKLIGLAWLIISVGRPSRRRLVLRTRLHRFIDNIGRWSNIDPFAIAVFAPLMQYGQVVHVEAGAGAVAFIFVVVLTMIASRVFDPRLMWDAAEEGW